MGKIVYNGREYLSAGTASTMQGATSTTDGVSGLVPQPLIADKDKVLKGDGTWGDASEVEANPSGTATDTLQTVDIDGTIYEIQGGGGGGSNLILDAQIYSTDEKQIGVWTDGKPLYQKTINCGALPNNTDKRIQHGIQNVDYFVGVFGIAENPNINSIPIIFSNTGGSGIVTIILEKSSDIIIRCNSDRSTYTKTFITLQYTKTTDAAGSGGYQAYGFTPIIYSTEEREIGVWIDNKPLYQKTIDVGQLPNNNTKSVTIDGNIDLIISYDGFVYSTVDRTSQRPLPMVGNTNDIRIDKVGTNLRLITYSEWSTYNGFVNITYTKTTDTAGSGQYNTLGVPNVHYSTDEQVIGTWIDGKPAYRKIYTGLNVMPAYNYWTDIMVPPANMDVYIGSDIILCESPNGNIDLNHTGLEIGFSKSGQMIQAEYNQNANLRPINILSILYTKTTD